MYPLLQGWKPFALAGNTCIDKVKHWAQRWGVPQENIRYVFEDGDKDKGELIKRCELNHGFSPAFEKKSAVTAFQGADLLAYEHRLANERIFRSGIGTLWNSAN
jgi:hypothetical protein